MELHFVINRRMKHNKRNGARVISQRDVGINNTVTKRLAGLTDRSVLGNHDRVRSSFLSSPFLPSFFPAF